MDKYFKLKRELKAEQDQMNNKLMEVLKENGYDEVFAWFNFREDELVMIWNDTRLPRKIIDALEEAFGRIDNLHIADNILSRKIFIKFGGEE